MQISHSQPREKGLVGGMLTYIVGSWEAMRLRPYRAARILDRSSSDSPRSPGLRRGAGIQLQRAALAASADGSGHCAAMEGTREDNPRWSTLLRHDAGDTWCCSDCSRRPSILSSSSLPAAQKSATQPYPKVRSSPS
jgi:hypothetical protein